MAGMLLFVGWFQCIWRGNLPHATDIGHCRSHSLLHVRSSGQCSVHGHLCCNTVVSPVACGPAVTSVDVTAQCYATHCYLTGSLLPSCSLSVPTPL